MEAAASTEPRSGLAAVYLYGSGARGRRTSLSDLDLAVLYGEEVADEERWEDLPAFGSSVEGALVESLGERPDLDLHDLEALPLVVQGSVLTGGRRASLMRYGDLLVGRPRAGRGGAVRNATSRSRPVDTVPGRP